MKQILFVTIIIVVVSIFGSCGQTDKKGSSKYYNLTELNPKDTLFRIHNEEVYEMGVKCGYINQKGDTVIPIGKYKYCYFDTVTTYAIVGDTSEFYAVDQKENRLYEIYWFDNGPDYTKDGLFRIKRNGKIGYANKVGKVIIEPQYSCADSFFDGRARVTFSCKLQKDGEHPIMKSDNWFYIDKLGKRLK